MSKSSLAIKASSNLCTWMMGVVTNVAFYPTLLWNVVWNKMMGDGWAWYSRIDNLVFLGALPFKSMIQKLVSEEKVGGVVCLNLPHEMDHDWVASDEDWKSAGVEHYWLPTPDFVHAPSAADVGHAVKFIRRFEDTGRTVYIHCKAGRSRSATVAACYLMEKNGWSAVESVEYLQKHRHQIVLRAAHWATLNQFSDNLKLSPTEIADSVSDIPSSSLSPESNSAGGRLRMNDGSEKSKHS